MARVAASYGHMGSRRVRMALMLSWRGMTAGAYPFLCPDFKSPLSSSETGRSRPAVVLAQRRRADSPCCETGLRCKARDIRDRQLQVRPGFL
jgi:hypothetical protein